jgi:hypothetical protein
VELVGVVMDVADRFLPYLILQAIYEVPLRGTVVEKYTIFKAENKWINYLILPPL